MKRVSALFLTGVIVLVFSGISFGAEYTYTTQQFQELDEDYAYSWKIDLTTLTSKDGTKNFKDDTGTLESVKLVFNDIKKNTYDYNLYVSVLNPAHVGIGKVSYNDYTEPYYGVYKAIPGNYFQQSGNINGDLLLTLKNVNPGLNSVTYNSGSDGFAALTAYSLDNFLALGFDSECKDLLKAGDIKLILTTNDSSSMVGPSTTPEPETLVLFGFGLLGLSAFGRKRFSSMG